MIDQRDRAVLHFGGRITFGVDVGNFLELQRPFERDREIVLPAKKEKVFGRFVFVRDLPDVIIVREHLLHLFRDGFQCAEDFLATPQGQHPHTAHKHRQQRHDRDLGRERFGGRHTNFRARMQINATIGFSRDGAPDHVANT